MANHDKTVPPPTLIERPPAPRPASEQPFDPMPALGPDAPESSEEVAALEPFRDRPRGAALTTDQGLPIAHTDDTLKAGVRGPSLLEGAHLREKITKFDHERIARDLDARHQVADVERDLLDLGEEILRVAIEHQGPDPPHVHELLGHELGRDRADRSRSGARRPRPPVQVPEGTSPPGPRGTNGGVAASRALSLEHQPKDTIATRKIAILVADGFDGAAAEQVRAELVRGGAIVEVVAPVLGSVIPAAGAALEADETLRTAASVLYDAVFVPGGAPSVARVQQSGDAVHFLQEAFKHGKAIAAAGEAVELIVLAELGESVLAGEDGEVRDDVVVDHGLVTARGAAAVPALAEAFCEAIAQHRHWLRSVDAVPA